LLLFRREAGERLRRRSNRYVPCSKTRKALRNCERRSASNSDERINVAATSTCSGSDPEQARHTEQPLGQHRQIGVLARVQNRSGTAGFG